MNFIVSGTIKIIKPIQSGVSASGSSWQKKEFVLKTTDEYDNEYCFTLFNEKADKNIAVGQDVTVHFNIKTNEWEGKHYTGLDAWKLEPVETPVS